MSALITTGIVLGSIFFYVSMAGAIWARLKRWISKEPYNHDHLTHYSCDTCAMLPVIGGAFWPLVIPLWVGMSIGQRRRLFGFRVRKMERVAKRIADMEKDIFNI